MKILGFFKNFFINVKNSISRYFTVFICSILFYLTACYEIIFETGADDIIIPLYMSFALAALLSVLLKSISEYLTNRLTDLIQYILCAVTAIAGFVLMHINYDSLYTTMSYTGIMIALICFLFFILMRATNRDLVFPALVSSAVFTLTVCGVLSAGLSICIWAFESLIFCFYDSWKVYLIVNLLVWVIGYLNVFLSFIPKKDVSAPQSKIFRIFVLFAGLPLYILLIAILLVYLAKIVITWHMPVGEINWFASFASLFFIFFVMSVMQYPEKLAKRFIKYGGYFLIPVLVMQAIAVFERINAYGLTTPRTVSLVLILIGILFIGGTIIAPKHLNKIAFASGMIVLLVTVTPFNVIDMPIQSQTAILKTVLVKNNMIKDGTVVHGENVSEEDVQAIKSSYNYLKYRAKSTPDFIPDSKKDFSEIFGFSATTIESQYKHCIFRTKAAVDITAYDRLIKVYDEDDMLHIEHNGEQYDINLFELAQELQLKYRENEQELELYQVNENVALYINSFSVEFRNDAVEYCHFTGYALVKN